MRKQKFFFNDCFLKKYFYILAFFISTHALSFASNTSDYTIVAGINYPYLISVSNYGAKGVAVDIITQALKNSNLTFSFDKTDLPWKRAMDTFNDEKNTIGFVTRTPGREKLYQWIEPILSDDLYVFTSKENKLIENFEELSKLNRIGVLAGSGSESLLITKGLINHRFLCKDDKQCLELLINGKIDAWVASKYKSSYWIKSLNKQNEVKKGMAVLETSIWAIASLSTQQKELTQLVNAFQKFTKKKEYSNILKEYE